MIHGMEIQYADILNISGCDVATIDEYLHDTLKHIYCAGNELRMLPDNIPDSVMYIYCYKNRLRRLPNILPRSLKILDCTHNYITCLPDINVISHITKLDCSYNHIEHINPCIFSGDIEVLYCTNNKITHITFDSDNNDDDNNIGTMVKTKIKELYISNNNICNLPLVLPESLQNIYCFNTNIKYISPKLWDKRNVINIENRYKLYKKGAMMILRRWRMNIYFVNMLHGLKYLHIDKHIPLNICYLIMSCLRHNDIIN